MFTTALYLSFIFWIVQFFENFANFQIVSRPIIISTIVGAALGDIRTGIIMGGLLEAIFMGVSGIGGVRPARQDISSFFCVTLVIQSGVDIETALALAMPFGALAAVVFNLWRPVNVMFMPLFDKWANEGNPKAFSVTHILFGLFIKPLGFVLILFFSLFLGTTQTAEFINIIPPTIMSGINAAGGALPIVGYAILGTMLWTKSIHFVWVLLGFLLMTFFNLPMIAVAGFAAIIAVNTFVNEYNNKKMMRNFSNGLTEDEDFING